jgi:uncharacterized membrane protein YozB (DUF420 family)
VIIRIIDADIGNFIVNLRTLLNYADYRTDIVLSPGDVTNAFKIAYEIFSKLSIIVSKIKESDIVLAWNNIKRKRQKKAHQKMTQALINF